MHTAEDIRQAVEPALAPLGLVVEDVSVSPAGKRRVVRVLVERDISDLDPTDASSPIAPLSLDAVAEGTRAVSDALDAGDVMGEAPYVLEVSSPGVGRPLTSREQLRRQVGRLVEVAHSGGTDTGRLVAVGDAGIVLDVPAEKKTPARRATIELDAVSRATVQVEFKRAGDTDPVSSADGDLDQHDALDEVDDAHDTLDDQHDEHEHDEAHDDLDPDDDAHPDDASSDPEEKN